jgi:hypothetical protein
MSALAAQADVEARMLAVLGELGLTGLVTTIPGLTATGRQEPGCIDASHGFAVVRRGLKSVRSRVVLPDGDAGPGQPRLPTATSQVSAIRM